GLRDPTFRAGHATSIENLERIRRAIAMGWTPLACVHRFMVGRLIGGPCVKCIRSERGVFPVRVVGPVRGAIAWLVRHWTALVCFGWQMGVQSASVRLVR